MTEALMVAGLYALGYVLAVGAASVGMVGACAVALPLGASVFTTSGVVLLAVQVPFSVEATSAFSFGVVGAVVALVRAGRWRWPAVAALVVGVVLVGGASHVLQEHDLTRYTPDSFDHFGVAGAI